MAVRPASSRTRTVAGDGRPLKGAKTQAGAKARDSAPTDRGEGSARTAEASEGEEGDSDGTAAGTTPLSPVVESARPALPKVAIKHKKEMAVQTDDLLLQSLSLPSLSLSPDTKKRARSPPPAVGKGNRSSLPAFSTTGTNTSKEDLFVVSVEMQLSIDWGEVDLPPKWLRKEDPAGRSYYVDLEKRKTQWRHPFDASGISVKKWKLQQQRPLESSRNEVGMLGSPTVTDVALTTA
jgi:hypothetical protein